MQICHRLIYNKPARGRMGKQILTWLCNTATQLLHIESLGAWQSMLCKVCGRDAYKSCENNVSVRQQEMRDRKDTSMLAEIVP